MCWAILNLGYECPSFLLMNSDPNDPKKRFTPVFSGDDWGDLDRVADTPQIVLATRRPHRGIPTKRELNKASVNRHVPHSKLSDDAQITPVEPISVLPKARVKPATKAARKFASKEKKEAPKRATKQSAKKSPNKSLKTKDHAPRKASGANAAVAKSVSVVESVTDEKEVPIPATVIHGAKCFIVKEIGSQGHAEKRMRKTPLTITRMAGKRSYGEALRRKGASRRQGKTVLDAKSVRLTLALMVGAGAVVIFIAVAATLRSRPSKVDQEPGKLSIFDDLTDGVTDKGMESKGLESLDTLINAEEQARAIFATYATSKSVDDFIGMIYLPEKNRILLSNDWEPMGVEPGWKPGENCTWTVSEKEGVKYGILSGVLANLSAFNAVFRLDGGRIIMDWRATSGHGSANFAELKKGQGDGAEIRALLSVGNFHTFVLPEGQFRCYRLIAPDRNENVWAYTKLDGLNDKMLLSQFTPSELTGEALRAIPVVLVLMRGSSESLPNQWIISKVTRLSWLDE